MKSSLVTKKRKKIRRKYNPTWCLTRFLLGHFEFFAWKQTPVRQSLGLQALKMKNNFYIQWFQSISSSRHLMFSCCGLATSHSAQSPDWKLTISSSTSAHGATCSSCLTGCIGVCFYLLLVCWAPICRILPYIWFACCQVPCLLCFHVPVLPCERCPPKPLCSRLGFPLFKDLLGNSTSCFVASLCKKFLYAQIQFLEMYLK